MARFRRLSRVLGTSILLIVLCITPMAACYFLGNLFEGLERRLDVCAAGLKDQQMSARMMTYKIQKTRERLDSFSYSYSPALEAMVGLFIADNAVRHERWQAAAELYCRMFPSQPFDSEKAWRYFTRKGILQEAKR